MHWSSGNGFRSDRRSRGRRARVPFVALIIVASALLLSGSPDEKHVSIYSTAANYSVPVIQRNNLDYLALLEALEPLGTVSANASGGRWNFRYNDIDSEFVPGKTHARVREKDIDLTASFLLENGRGLVPLSSLATLLPRILGGPVTFNEAGRRLLIGNVAVHFTAQVSNTNPPKLVMNFTAPVNPTISTEPGKLRMMFTREPLVAPGSQALTFGNKVIPSATFQENNGTAEVVVTSTVPVMASFSNDGRTITIAPPAVVLTQAQPAVQPSATTFQPAVTASNTGVLATGHYFAVVDASHGGDERGAALTAQLGEKEVTLAFARLLRQELDARGLATLLVRDGDITLTPDQRAAMTNTADPAIYICVHAASQGSGVRLYTALTSGAGQDQGPFVDWDTAQASFLGRSQAAAASVATELKNKQVPVRSLAAPLRPLNNIITAALAVEVSPAGNDVSQLTSSTYQQSIAGAVAAGIADVRDKLQGGQK